ncbi:s-adenosylmethionine carrier protein [Anaeramoeba ignava]|uniref:S-adenosylmethionine carrier protein n=1 Tax=Anaeramoeba ignava TaxID=1746090 RepID=A0A9Q0R4X9_ANAIG|nr:s-adenosylmethionine carrier protein [Anaeramoeba ignava]
MNKTNEEKEIKKEFEPIKHLIAGGVSRIVSVILTAPFDTMKTRVQFHGSHLKSRGYMKGILASLVSTVPSTALSFFLYHYVKTQNQYKNFDEDILPIHHSHFHGLFLHAKNFLINSRPFLDAALARMIVLSIRNPIEISKQRMQLERTALIPHMTLSQTLLYLYRHYGISELFTGYSAYLLRDIISTPVYWFTYDYIRNFPKSGSNKKLNSNLKNQKEKIQKIHPIKHILSVSAATIMSTTLTIPVDVIKTKMQTRRLVENGDKKYSTIMQTAKTVYQENGVKYFIKGLGSRLFSVLPSSIISHFVYEWILEIWDHYKLILSQKMSSFYLSSTLSKGSRISILSSPYYYQENSSFNPLDYFSEHFHSKKKNSNLNQNSNSNPKNILSSLIPFNLTSFKKFPITLNQRFF